MKDKLQKIVRPADLIVVAAVLAVAAVLWAVLAHLTGTTAQIVCDGEVIATIDLSAVKEAYDVTLDNGVTVRVEPGAICFAASDCANLLCIHAGKLTRAGQSAACLPNKTLIRITGRDRRGPDALTG
ncbi:MAG: NusG domain II-containing protein [Clostridia bacterium]|nr:NusG domain II-containing protein [Clostridia bacterium]